METTKKRMLLDKQVYYETHLQLLNCFRSPTKKISATQIRVLAGFMSLEGDITNDLFGSSARKIVKDALNLGTASMSNYLRTMNKEGMISLERNAIHPTLVASRPAHQYMFRLEIKKGNGAD